MAPFDKRALAPHQGRKTRAWRPTGREQSKHGVPRNNLSAPFISPVARTPRDSNRMGRRAWESWGSWSDEVGHTLDQAAGSSLGRPGPPGARTVQGGVAATPRSWGDVWHHDRCAHDTTSCNRHALRASHGRPRDGGPPSSDRAGCQDQTLGLRSHPFTQRRDSLEGPWRAAVWIRKEGRRHDKLVRQEGSLRSRCDWPPSSREPITRREPVPPVPCRFLLRPPPTIPHSFLGKRIGQFGTTAVAVHDAMPVPVHSPCCSDPSWFELRVSNCLEVKESTGSCSCQNVRCLSIALRIVNNLRIQATNATLRFCRAHRVWYVCRMTGLQRVAAKVAMDSAVRTGARPPQHVRGAPHRATIAVEGGDSHVGGDEDGLPFQLRHRRGVDAQVTSVGPRERCREGAQPIRPLR